MLVILTLIVYVMVLGLLWWLITLLELPAPFPKIIQVLFVLLAIFAILGVFGIIPGGLPHVRL